MWTNEQRTIIEKYFWHFINDLVVPGKDAIVRCMQQESALCNRSWRAIKDVVNARVQKRRKLLRNSVNC